MNDESVDPSFPIVEADFQLNQHICSGRDNSEQYVKQWLLDRYVGIEKTFDKQVPSAWIDLYNLTYENYLAKVKKTHSGNALRNAKKSDKRGYIVKQFDRRTFIPDIVSIHHSKQIRSHGPMPPRYFRTVEEMGGPPKRYIPFQYPECPLHYSIDWGIFSPESGYMQGEVMTNEKLLGYINIRRIGNFSTYRLIIGHGDYLQYGIMHRLHFAIMEWICRREDDYTRGLKHLMYAGMYSGNEGLQLWKKITCFEPVYFVTPYSEELG